MPQNRLTQSKANVNLLSEGPRPQYIRRIVVLCCVLVAMGNVEFRLNYLCVLIVRFNVNVTTDVIDGR